MTQTHLSDVAFDQLGLAPEVLEGVANAGFVKCTPIQAQTLPMAIRGQDVAGQAQTGTGKSAAFLLAMFHRLLNEAADDKRTERDTRAFILAPTRELAIQIYNDAETLGGHLGFKIRLIYGGTDYEKQRRSLEEGVDVIIGTPGRVIDYYKQGLFTLNYVQVVVLDEADRMFDLGFIKDIRFLLRRCPKPEQRLGMLFSATLSYRVTELAYEHMNNPQLIKIENEQITADKVHETSYMTGNEDKIPLLLGLLRRWQRARTIVFVNTKRTADQVWGYLEGNGFKAAILSGDVPQKKRTSLLSQFTQGELDVLVATDVAARGLHIPAVTHVVNYDLPEDAEDYVHRIGRTARAGASGEAISFACETFAFSLPDIEAFVGHKIPIEPVALELLADVDPASRVRVHRKKPLRSAGGQKRPRHAEGHKARPDGEGAPKKRRRRRRSPGGGEKPKSDA